MTRNLRHLTQLRDDMRAARKPGWVIVDFLLKHSGSVEYLEGNIYHILRAIILDRHEEDETYKQLAGQLSKGDTTC